MPSSDDQAKRSRRRRPKGGRIERRMSSTCVLSACWGSAGRRRTCFAAADDAVKSASLLFDEEPLTCQGSSSNLEAMYARKRAATPGPQRTAETREECMDGNTVDESAVVGGQ